MNVEIERAKKLLEDNGYVVARVAHSGWRKEAVRLDDNYVAFRLDPEWKRFPNRSEYAAQEKIAWITPNSFCRELGIDRHMLTRKAKHKYCPPFRQERGPTGRLIVLEPTQALIDYLLSYR